MRELENFVRKFLVLRDADLLARELNAQVDPQIADARQSRRGSSRACRSIPRRAPILEQVTKAKQLAETEAILAALNSTRWNRKQAATC